MTRALTPNTIVRMKINRPQGLLRERRTLFQNCQFKLSFWTLLYLNQKNIFELHCSLRAQISFPALKALRR